MGEGTYELLEWSDDSIGFVLHGNRLHGSSRAGDRHLPEREQGVLGIFSRFDDRRTACEELLSVQAGQSAAASAAPVKCSATAGSSISLSRLSLSASSKRARLLNP